MVITEQDTAKGALAKVIAKHLIGNIAAQAMPGDEPLPADDLLKDDVADLFDGALKLGLTMDDLVAATKSSSK